MTIFGGGTPDLLDSQPCADNCSTLISQNYKAINASEGGHMYEHSTLGSRSVLLRGTVSTVVHMIVTCKLPCFIILDFTMEPGILSFVPGLCKLAIFEICLKSLIIKCVFCYALQNLEQDD